MRQLILASHRSGLDPFHRYNGNMVGRECYHCKHWVEEGEEHDCWTKTETALTQDLSGALQDAWERLRETAVSFGDQRIYASHKSVMFSRKSCYFFVRPKRKFLDSQLHNILVCPLFETNHEDDASFTYR